MRGVGGTATTYSGTRRRPGQRYFPRLAHASPQNYLTPQEALKREKIDRPTLYLALWERERERRTPSSCARPCIYRGSWLVKTQRALYLYILFLSLEPFSYLFIYFATRARTHTQNIMEAGRSVGDIKNTFCRLSARRLTYFTYFPMPASIPTLILCLIDVYARALRQGRMGRDALSKRLPSSR